MVGALVAAVALFGGLAFLSVQSSTDARIERAVARIAEEYGFEYSTEYASYHNGARRPLLADIYTGRALGQEEKGRIVARLERACPSCTTELVKMGDTSPGFTLPFAEPTYDVHYWFPEDGSAIWSVMFVFDDRGISSGDDAPSSMLTITRYSDSGPWSFLKRLWPW